MPKDHPRHPPVSGEGQRSAPFSRSHRRPARLRLGCRALRLTRGPGYTTLRWEPMVKQIYDAIPFQHEILRPRGLKPCGDIRFRWNNEMGASVCFEVSFELKSEVSP